MEFKISRFNADLENLKVIEKYDVGLCNVIITEDGRYVVQEPKISIHAEKIFNDLMNSIRTSIDKLKTDKDEILENIKNELEKESKKSGKFDVWKQENKNIEYYLKRHLLGYSEIDVLINDPNIEDILCVKWDKLISIVHNKYDKFPFLITNISFQSHDDLSSLIQRISQEFGDPPNNTYPISSFTNESNMRFTFTGNRKITPDGCTMSIRKPSTHVITIYDLIKDGILTPLSASYLWIMTDLKSFGLVIGSTSAGKTTMINAMFTMCNPIWHYFVIEDALELRLLHHNVTRHNTTGNSSIRGEINSKSSLGVFELCKLSLRFRPDYVIVGEILGKEAEGLFQVGSSGSGVISSFHASNPNDALTRLESEPIKIPPINTNLISYFLHLAWVQRDKHRLRRVLSITESIPKYGDDYKVVKQLRNVFSYDVDSDLLIVPKTDSSELDEVKRLVVRSQKLNNAKVILGINDIESDLKQRMAIFQKIIDESITTPENISKEIFKYYVE